MIIENNNIRSGGNEIVAHVDNDSNQFVIDRGVVGTVVQSVATEYTAWAALTALISAVDTIPQVSSGTQILSVTITPKTVGNKLRMRFSGIASASANTNLTCALFTSQSSNAAGANVHSPAAANVPNPIYCEAETVILGASPITISVRVGPTNAVSIYMNGVSTSRLYGGAAKCVLVVEEIQQ